MNEKEKPSQEVWFKELHDLNMTEFYREVKDAIQRNNINVIYQLSKIIARYHFKDN